MELITNLQISKYTNLLIYHITANIFLVYTNTVINGEIYENGSTKLAFYTHVYNQGTSTRIAIYDYDKEQLANDLKHTIPIEYDSNFKGPIPIFNKWYKARYRKEKIKKILGHGIGKKV